MLESLKKTMCSVTAAAVITTTLGMSAVFANDTASGADYTYSIKEAYFSSSSDKLNVNIEYTGESAKPAKLIAASYNESGVVTNAKVVDVNGTEKISFDYAKESGENVKLYVWDSMDTISPLSSTTVPTQRTGNEKYTVSVAEGITGGTVKIVQPESNISEFFAKVGETSSEAEAIYTDDENLKVQNIFETTITKNLEAEGVDPVEVDINGRKCCDFIAVRLGSEPVSYDTLSPSGTKSALDIMPKKNGKFTIYYRWQSDSVEAGMGRDTKLKLMNEDGTYSEQIIGERVETGRSTIEPNVGNFVYGYQTFDIEANNSYLLYCVGSTSEVFGYTFEPAEEAELSSDTELSAEEVLVDTLAGVKAGDTVTLKVTADDPESKITVTTDTNAKVTEVADNPGYYTFTMPEDDTVINAEFKVSNTSEYLVTESTPTDEDSYLNNDIILMNDDNIKVTNLFRAKIMDNLEKDPGDPISVEIEGKNCCKYIPIGLSSAPSDYDSLSPSGKGTALDITAKKNGTFTIYHRWYTDGRSLKISVWNEDFSSAEELSVENTSVSGSILPDAAVNVQYGYGTFDVEAGKTYLLWSSGYTPEVFGYTFEPAEE